MDWGEAAVRALLQIAMAAALLAAFISTNGGVQRVGPILYIPFFFGPFAVASSLLILTPIEWMLRDRLGSGVHLLTISAGIVLPLLWALAIGGWRSAKQGAGCLSFCFGGWALLWAATRPLYRAIAG